MSSQKHFYSLVNPCTRSNILSILSCEYHSSQKVFKPCRAFHLQETNKQTNSRIRLNGTSERWDPSRRSTILWVQITMSTIFSSIGRTRIDAFRIQLSFCDFCVFLGCLHYRIKNRNAIFFVVFLSQHNAILRSPYCKMWHRGFF